MKKLDKPAIKQIFRDLFSFKNLILFLSVYIILPRKLMAIPGIGLDCSWQIAINMAIKQHLIFGKEFVFTFGPLGYLYTDLVFYVSKINVISFHLFLFACMTFIINFYLKEIKSNLSRVVFFIVLFFTSTHLYYERAFLLTFIFLFFVFFYLHKKKKYALYIAGFIALLSFFIKMNTGLLLSILLLILLIYLFVVKIERWKFCISYLLVYLSLIFCLSLFLNVALYSYITTSLDIINFYNDAMVQTAPFNMLLYAGAIISIYLIIVVSNFRIIISDKIRVLIFAYVSLAIFVIFKEGFVRADGHMMLFFWNIVALLSLLFFFANNIRLKKHLLYGLLLTGFFSTMSVPVYFQDYDPILDVYNTKIQNIPYRDFFLEKYPRRFNDAMADGKNTLKTPQRILEKVENGTIDILPSEISYLFYNDLKYNPRPVIQSYSAYSARLDALNSDKYSSKDSPDYLLYSIFGIDDRHPFWDESKTKLTMLAHFEVNDTMKIFPPAGYWGNSEYILLKKRVNPYKAVEISRKNIIYHLGDTLQIPKTDNLIYLYADIQYSLLGKLRRLLFQTTLITASIAYDSNFTSKNIALIPILRGGVLVNKKVLNFEDACVFFKTSGHGNINSQSICFTPKSIWFRDKVNITLCEVKVE